MGEVARAVIADGCSNASLKDAAKVDKAHSETNAHRLFFRYGLASKVPISELTFPNNAGDDTINISYLKPSDFLSVLLKQYPQVLFGGLGLEESGRLCAQFWQRFEMYHPEHVLYKDAPVEERGSYIPLFLHGDKGPLQKSPIFVWSFETPWGLPPNMLDRSKADHTVVHQRTMHDGRLSWTCSKRAKNFYGKHTYDDMAGCTMENPSWHLDPRNPNSHQRRNSKGHSYLSRFLVAAIPSKVYKRNSRVLPGILEETARELEQLYSTGLQVSGGRVFKFAFLGIKGDAEFHWEAGNFNRSYHRSGTKNELEICPLCEAGSPGVSYTDAAEAPSWRSTMGISDPWDQPPPLSGAPFASSFAAFMYKFDPFHVLKFGVFRDAVASTIVRIALMRYFDYEADASMAIESRLQRAFSMFKLWCLANGKNPGLKQFSKANLNFEKYKSYAWVNAKGSDVTLLMMWLEFLLPTLVRDAKSPGDVKPLQAMYQMIHGGLTYVGLLHSHGVWVPGSCARLQYDAGMKFCRGYLFLADHCMHLRVSGYRLRPKLHYLHHLLYDIKRQLENPACEFVFSAGTLLCESNEDFIGRLNRVSRRVSARTAGFRTTQRYLVKLLFLLKRHCK